MTERTGGSFSLLCAGRSKCLSKKKKKRFNAFLLFFDPSEKQPLSKQVQKLAAKLEKKKSTFVKKKKTVVKGRALCSVSHINNLSLKSASGLWPVPYKDTQSCVKRFHVHIHPQVLI